MLNRYKYVVFNGGWELLLVVLDGINKFLLIVVSDMLLFIEFIVYMCFFEIWIKVVILVRKRRLSLSV